MACLSPVLFGASSALAEDDATAALKKGYELKKAGKCAEAVVFLRESFEKKPSAKAVLNWAECEESAGKFLAARAHYLEGRRLAEIEKQAELTTLADSRIAAIGPRVPRVTFTLPDGTSAPKAEISIDGAKQSTLSDVEIDPGEHRATVALEGHREGAEVFSIAPGEKRTVVLRLGEPFAGRPATGPNTPVSPTDPVLADRTDGHGQRLGGALLFGGGLVLVGVGSVLGLTAKGDYDSAVKASCDPAGCDAQGRDAIASARSQATVATVFFVAGGLVTVGGAVLWLTAKKSPIRAGVAGSGLLIRGTF